MPIIVVRPFLPFPALHFSIFHCKRGIQSNATSLVFGLPSTSLDSFHIYYILYVYVFFNTHQRAPCPELNCLPNASRLAAARKRIPTVKELHGRKESKIPVETRKLEASKHKTIPCHRHRHRALESTMTALAATQVLLVYLVAAALDRRRPPLILPFNLPIQ